MGSMTKTYEVERGLVDGKNIIVFRPAGAYASVNAVSITAQGTTNARGEYNLANYRESAVNAGLTKVVEVVDALYTYVEAAKSFVNTTQK